MKTVQRRRRRRWLLPGLALAAALLHGCGLEDDPVLNPPSDPDVSDIYDYFAFRITENNGDAVEEPEFRGVEVYYKFYSSIAEVQSGLVTQSELVSAGFRRFASTDDRTTLIEYPLIPVPDGDRGKRATITLDFSPLGLVTPTQPLLTAVPDAAGLTIPATEFRRGVGYSVDNTFKKFYSEDADGFVKNDGDIPGLTTAGDHDVYIALYALCYGKKDLASTIYSRALFLSPIEVTIHVTS